MGGSRQEDCCDRQKDGATFFLQWGICGSLEQVGGFSSSWAAGALGDKLSVVPTPVCNSGGEVVGCPGPVAGCRALSPNNSVSPAVTPVSLGQPSEEKVFSGTALVSVLPQDCRQSHG